MRSVSFGLAIGFLAITFSACGGDEVKPQPVTPVAPVVDAAAAAGGRGPEGGAEAALRRWPSSSRRRAKASARR